MPPPCFYFLLWVAPMEVWLARQCFNTVLPYSLRVGGGIYDEVTHTDGWKMFAMAMLTVNADNHEFMRQFHKPGEEKRMVVILDPKNYAEWLTCPLSEADKYMSRGTGRLKGSQRRYLGEPRRRSLEVPQG